MQARSGPSTARKTSEPSGGAGEDRAVKRFAMLYRDLDSSTATLKKVYKRI